MHIIDESGAIVATVDTADLFDVDAASTGGGGPGGGGYWGQTFPGAEDVSHANSVYVGEDGELIVSFRFFDVVVGVDGDPDSGSFGSLLWSLEGQPGTLFDSDYDIVASAGSDDSFEAQHCARRGPSGALTLFDNKEMAQGPSRGIVVELDDASGTADIVAEYSADEECGVQSAIYELPSGDGQGAMIPRGVPVDW